MRLKKRILSIALSLCMAFSMTPMPVSATETIVPVTSDVAVSQNDVITPTDAAQVITEFAALTDDVREQQLEIGAEESAIILPDTLQVKVGEADVELTGITWSIDAENSAADSFDSSEDMNGAYYTYKPMIPAEYTLADDVEVPEIVVLVGENQITTYSLTAPEQDANGVYQIGTFDDLQAFAAIVNGTGGFTKNISANAVLTQDIDFQKKYFTPIGNSAVNGYKGTFDGQGHSISNLYLPATTTDNIGLFGWNSGTIKNVSVLDSELKGKEYVGGVCGVNLGGTITNCSYSGSVSGTAVVGGVCGGNAKGTITNCINSGTVNGSMEVGGVCGYNYANSSITNCINSGNVSGSGSATGTGGVCGTTEEGGTITNCINSGSVSDATGDKGGVCGYAFNKTDITNCYYDNDKCTVGGIRNADLTGGAEGKTTAAFLSGEVTYLLNGSTSTPAEGEALVWYQTLGTDGDDYPVLDSTHGTVYKNGDSYTNTNPNAVASVTTSEGTELYETLEKAVTAAAGKTATITLLADIDTTAPVTIPADSDITLDLNGCTIDRGTPALDWRVLGFVIFNQGTLTIQDNGEDKTKIGTITGGNDESFAGGIQNDGTLTIEGGKITGNHIEDGSGGGGITNTGTLTITGGIITGNTIGTDGTFIGAGIACHRGTLTIEGGTIQDDIYIRGGTVALTGGIFSKIVVSSINYKTMADLLGDASGYKVDGSWATADQLTAKSIESENLTVEEAPVKITTKPTAEATLDFGSTVKLEVVTDPTEGVSYQWADKGTDITGATEASYTTDKNMALGDHRFTCKLTLGDYTAITKAVPISYNYAEPTQDGGVYQIATASNLMWFVAHVNDTTDTANQSANAVLTADIDMDGIAWTAMANYAGTFDGAGFTISNLTGQNLIRTLASGGTVKNIRFDNANVAVYETLGNGVIAGTSYGTISGCVVTNSYLAYGKYNYCGGIAGRNDGTIQNCAVLNSTLERIQGGRGQKPIGGIADTNNGTVQNCYAYNVTLIDASVAGGICANYDPDTNTVKGTAPTNSYYYTTSNVTSTVDGTAKTTDEFVGGAVTWLLNGSWSNETFTPGANDGTQVWYQNLSEVGDTYPVLKSTGSNTVYKNGDNYANTPKYTITTTSSVKGSDSNVTVSQIEVLQDVEAGKATVIALEKDGYKFLGWYLATDDTAGYDTSASAKNENLSYTFDLKSDIGLVAVYEANAKAKVDISGNGFKVQYDSTMTEEQNSNYNVDLQLGTTVTLTASDADSFLYWKNENGKIMSKSASYTFTVTGKTNLTLVTKATAENTAFVEFVSAYNQVISGGVYSATSTDLIPPTDIPSKVGYIFVEWSMTVEKIKAAITAGEKHITVTPVYEVKAEKYSIELFNAQGGTKISETPVTYTDLAPGSTKTLTAETIEGKKFKCWSLDVAGTTVLGTSESYFMQLSSNVTIYAIYVDAAEKVEKVPTIVMTNKYASTVSGTDKVSFVATRTVPEGYTLVEQGMLYSKEGSVSNPTEESFIVGGENIYRYASSDTAANGVFTMNIKTPAADTLIYARAYMIVKDSSTGNETIIYSALDSGKFNELGN